MTALSVSAAVAVVLGLVILVAVGLYGMSRSPQEQDEHEEGFL